MSQIKLPLIAIFIAAGLTLSGCGDKNDKAIFTADSGHPSDWVGTHKTSARADAASCTECHGENYTSGISKVSCMSATAISGFSCHVTSPVANLTGCVSCHGGSPSGPFGSAAPNMKSAHTKHTSLAGIGCDSCHADGGPGTAGHAKADDVTGGRRIALVNMPPVFNANAAVATFDKAVNVKTCSNVSCHGGQTTPAWNSSNNLLAAGDNDKCKKCHELGSAAGQPQYNSYYSGHHVYHLSTNVNAKCTDCHNIYALLDFQKHFSGVASNTVVAPRQTIGIGAPTKITTYSATKTCLGACHATETFPWVQP